MTLAVTLRDRRTQSALIAAAVLAFSLLVVASAILLPSPAVDMLSARQAPSPNHPFGTGPAGRDLFVRTVQALARSLGVGLAASSVAALIGLLTGLLAAEYGGLLDTFITWLVDALFSVPHLILMILIAFAVGGGTEGVIWAVALTHWGGMARLMRAEAAQQRGALYVRISERLGKSSWWIARKHLLPHLLPQFITGLVLLFPHAILHESALSFIGLGFSPQSASIGVMLAEAMPYLPAGNWWLVVFPGLALLLLVLSFDALGNALRDLMTPETSQL